jgi:hypothetical protein
VADVFDDGQIVGNEQVGQPVLLLEVLEQVDDLGLHRNIQSADRFIANDQLRLDRQRPRDADPLPLAPAELMRVTTGIVAIQPDGFQQLGNPLPARGSVFGQIMNVQGFTDDVFDGQARVERIVGVLEDDLHFSPARTQILPLHRRQIFAVKKNFSRGRFDQTNDCSTEGGFAATAFSDQPQGFSRG